MYQPPSGGCVLKQLLLGLGVTLVSQPPSGGCVLKQAGNEIGGQMAPSRLQAAVC